MENLVQDLQDELEMKEGLTVKELLNETSSEHDGKVSLYNILTTFLTHSDQLTKSFCILSADNR